MLRDLIVFVCVCVCMCVCVCLQKNPKEKLGTMSTELCSFPLTEGHVTGEARPEVSKKSTEFYVLPSVVRMQVFPFLLLN